VNRSGMILIFLVFITLLQPGRAQEFSDIQRYTTPILLNPSFVGATRGDRLMVALQSTRRQDTQALLKLASHDFFVRNKSLGLGFLGGIRMDYTQEVFAPFAEASIAKYFPKANRKYLIPSVTLGLHQPLRELSVFVSERILQSGSSSPLGGFFGTTELVAGAGILFSDYHGSVGISGKARWSFKKNPQTNELSTYVYNLLLHAEKIFTWRQRGLLSRSYLIRPRAVLHYSTDFVQAFAEVTIQRKQVEAGIGFLPNFDTGNSQLSLNLGYDFNDFKVNYLGAILNRQGQFIHPMHSITISVIFPELTHFDKAVPALIRNL